MSTLEGWIDYWNRMVKRFTIFDVKLAQIWAAAWTLALVRIVPQIMQVSVWWFVLLAALCAPRLFYVGFYKKTSQHTDSGE